MELAQFSRDEIKAAWNNGAVYGGTAPRLVCYLRAYQHFRQIGYAPRDAMCRAEMAADLNRQFFPRQVSRFKSPKWEPDSRGFKWFEIREMAKFGFRFVGSVETGRNGIQWHDDNPKFGYYKTNEQDSDAIYSGAVVQCPGTRKQARIFAAVIDKESNHIGIEIGKPVSVSCDGSADIRYYSETRDVAYSADSDAEYMAEDSREYDSAWQAGSQFAYCGERIVEARKECLAILAERRKASSLGSGFATLGKVIREKVSELREEIAELRNKREELRNGDADGFCFYPSDELRSAFNDGAGIQA